MKKSDNLAQSASTHIENTHEFMQSALENLERVTKLNFEASKRILDDLTDAMKEMTTVTNPKDFFDRCSQLTTITMESSMCNCRDMYNLASEAQNNISKFIESNMQQVQRNISDTVDDLSQFAPSNTFTDSFKNMVNGANQTMNTVSQVATQVSKFAHDNIKAATAASINAAKKASSGTSKKAN